MTIKEYLEKHFPHVLKVDVEVSEFCLDDHPPGHITWHYSEASDIQHEGGSLYHDPTVLRTATFDTTGPVTACIHRKIDTHEGKLRAYHTDDGKTVTRSYKVRIIYKPEERP